MPVIAEGLARTVVEPTGAARAPNMAGIPRRLTRLRTAICSVRRGRARRHCRRPPRPGSVVGVSVTPWPTRPRSTPDGIGSQPDSPSP